MPVPHRRGDLHQPGPGPRRDPQLRRRRVRRALPALPGRPPGDLQRRPTRRDHQGRPGSAHRSRAAGFDAGAGRSWPSTWSPRGGRQGVVDDYQPPRTAPAAGPGGRVRSTGAERRRPRPTRTTRPRRTGGSSCLRSPTPQRRPGPGDPTVIVSLDEFGPLNPASPEEQAGMIRRYLGWRNRHADDEQLPEIVARAQVA